MTTGQKWLLAGAIAGFLVCGVGIAQAVNRTATLSWGAVTTDTEGGALTGVTYNIYQGDCGMAKVKVATDVTDTRYVANNLPAGKRTCFNVSASANGVEGGLSAEGGKTFPALGPAAVGALTVE